MDKRDVIVDLKLMQQQMEQATVPEVSVCDSTKLIGELGWLRREPPEEDYVFTQPDAFSLDSGFLPAGEPAMLIGPGGVGKTFALIQCAIAAATGTKWLGTFQATKPSTVILITAEETERQLWRRIRSVFFSLGLHKTPLALELLEKHLAPVALRGKNKRFIDKDRKETPGFADIMKLLHKFDDCRLVILDPASRFMGPECEVDNAAATDWVDLLTRLTETPGKPAVLVAHHTNKGAIRPNSGDNSSTINQSAARGSSALVDGVRWVAALQKKTEDNQDRILFKLVKSNYSAFPEPLELYRDFANGGILRVPTPQDKKKEPAAVEPHKRLVYTPEIEDGGSSTQHELDYH
jgi:regulatory protein RepA